MSQAPSNSRRTLVYDSSTQSFRTPRSDKDTSLHSITICSPFKWYFIDADRDLKIYVDFESALEVEAGYQLRRKYVLDFHDPRGKEGQFLSQPPKEVNGSAGYYRGKNYCISFSDVVASRASKNAINGKHVECYQENVSTGFMRTLRREPQDSYAKPFSGLHVETKVIRNDDEQLVIEVDPGKSLFGYEYERTWFTFLNVVDEETRKILIYLGEDGELFRLEIPRSASDELRVFPRRGVAKKALLKIKQSCQFVNELNVVVNRTTDPVVFDVVDLKGSEEQGVDEEKEGEININKVPMMANMSNSSCHSLSKFDKYSYMDRVHKINDCGTQYCPRFNKFHLDEDGVDEYKQNHFGEFPVSDLRVNQKKLFGLCVGRLVKMHSIRCSDLICLILKNQETCDIIHVIEVPCDSSVACRDSVYNKLMTWINENTSVICLVTVRVSCHFRTDYGQEGMMCGAQEEEGQLELSDEFSQEAEVEDCEAGEDFDFVSYLGFGGRMMLLTDEAVQPFCRD